MPQVKSPVESEFRPRLFQHQSAPGSVPGTVVSVADGIMPTVEVIAYGPDDYLVSVVDSLDGIDDFLMRFPVTWINVDGLGDGDTISRLGEKFGLHLLALEDVVHVHQRAKVEAYDDNLFVVVRMLESTLPGHQRLGASSVPSELSTSEVDPDEEPWLSSEQLSIFIGRGFVLTFQDGRPGDCLDSVRERIHLSRGHIRRLGADALAYAILDCVIDYYFPAVEHLASRLDVIEDNVIEGTGKVPIGTLHGIRSDLVELRRILRPHAEALHQLMRDQSDLISTDTKLFLRDCHDHTQQLLDAIETCRETCSDLRDAHFTSLSMRQNEVMQTLTTIATLFIPMSFIAGLYGMNFDYMPELHWAFGYPFALSLMVCLATGFLVWFYKRGWFDRT